MNDSCLSIFIPTFHRPQKLKRCLDSICEEIDKLNFAISVHISSNDVSDVETEKVVKKYQKSRKYIFYHANSTNIGIDRNHDLLYDYCNTSYVLILADDDFMLPDTLIKILDFCRNDSFLFALCNQRFSINDILKSETLYQCDIEEKKMNRLTALKQFTIYRPPAILPLLPYFGGIIVNLDMVSTLVSKEERRVFEGTFHQYIGALWCALFKSDENVFILNDISIGQGFDDDKTWFAFKEEVYSNISKFYQLLPIDERIRRDILLLLRFKKRWLNRIASLVCIIRSRRWHV